MSDAMKKGLIVAVVQVLLVASLGGKLLFDRATRPRVWARTAPFDPDLPIRGRYVRMRIEGQAVGLSPESFSVPVSVEARDGALVIASASQESRLSARLVPERGVAILDQPLAFFISEHVPDPSIRPPGEELWVEVTLPRRGPPRPIRLGIKKDGVLTPLE